jgi:hypothetical protein
MTQSEENLKLLEGIKQLRQAEKEMITAPKDALKIQEFSIEETSIKSIKFT